MVWAGALSAQQAPANSSSKALDAEAITQAEERIKAQIEGQQKNNTAEGPSLKPNPLDVLRKFEPSENEPYLLGRGDEITIDVTGRPEMQAKLVIGPDGRVSLPLAGEVLLAGETRVSAAKIVSDALSKYYPNLEAHLTINKYTSNRVLLLGAVEYPGMLSFEGTPTLLEVLARGGMPSETYQRSQDPTKHMKVPERCAIYRGQNQVVWVELRALIEQGNPLADLRLRRGDVVYVPSGAERVVSVLGQVQHPGPVELHADSTLASVLADAGGFSEKAGNKPHIQIFDPKTGHSVEVSMKDLLTPGRVLEVSLRPGDIVYVSQSNLYRATYILERLSPLLSVATMAIVDWRP